MALSLTKVHIEKEDIQTGRTVLISSAPYSRYIKEGETPVIVQRGKFYTDGGDLISEKDLPPWVRKQIGRMSERGRAKVGLESFDVSVEDVASAVGPTLTDEAEPRSLVEAIMSLDHSDDAHWTRAGLPDLNVIKELCQKYHSRDTVSAAVPDFRRKQEE